MSPADHRLLRHLLIAVAVKMAVLTLLWWAFIREARVPVDSERAAAHLGGAASVSPGASK